MTSASCADQTRVLEVHRILEEELWRHACIQVHHGKTQVWNRGGIRPESTEILTQVVRISDPDAVVWKRDAEIPDQERGVRVLGAPIGSSECVLAQLNAKSREQRLLFQRIPAVPDLQSAWLLLLLCGATRANFWLRMVRPELTAQFAEQHDNNVWQCFATLLGLPEGQPTVAVSMPLNKSGLGLGSAVRSWRATHWANWADCLSMVNKRDPATAQWMVEGIQHDPAACFHAVREPTGIGQHWFCAPPF